MTSCATARNNRPGGTWTRKCASSSSEPASPHAKSVRRATNGRAAAENARSSRASSSANAIASGSADSSSRAARRRNNRVLRNSNNSNSRGLKANRARAGGAAAADAADAETVRRRPLPQSSKRRNLSNPATQQRSNLALHRMQRAKAARASDAAFADGANRVVVAVVVSRRARVRTWWRRLAPPR